MAEMVWVLQSYVRWRFHRIHFIVFVKDVTAVEACLWNGSPSLHLTSALYIKMSLTCRAALGFYSDVCHLTKAIFLYGLV